MKTKIEKLVETLEMAKSIYGRDTVKIDTVIEFCKKDLDKYGIEQD
jgi:hypothetical protein